MSKAAQEVFRSIQSATFVWTTGVGKSAAIADLLARYLRNVGVPSAYLDATDYWHGGRGGVKEGHLLVAVSANGRTEEVLRVANDSPCEVLHIGREPLEYADMHWRIGESTNGRAVSSDPMQSARAVYDLVCEYAQYMNVSRHEADAYHPAGVTNGSV